MLIPAARKGFLFSDPSRSFGARGGFDESRGQAERIASQNPGQKGRWAQPNR